MRVQLDETTYNVRLVNRYIRYNEIVAWVPAVKFLHTPSALLPSMLKRLG